MANIREWLEAFEAKNGDKIVSIVVGRHYNDSWNLEEGVDRRPEGKRDVVLSREDGLAILHEDYNSGYGGADCYPMYAWTGNHVLSISEYDGATRLSALPRNPIDCEPQFD